MKRIVVVGLLAVLGFVSSVDAQSPPNTWHPYKGGTNCVQVVDRNGNFNCSPLVTIDPETGAFSALGPTGAVSPIYGALVIAPQGNSLQALGNDLVLASSSRTVAPAGPGTGAASLRVRPSTITPGYCQLVVAGGNSFVETVIALVNPTGVSQLPIVEFPGGPGGC
jgi:hypothetical protein